MPATSFDVDLPRGFAMQSSTTGRSTPLLEAFCLASTLLLSSACAGSTAPETPLPARAVLISTDNAAGIWESEEYPAGAPFDDFLALMQALNEPSLDVRGILPLFGNHLAATAVFTTEFLLRHKGAPRGADLVARGADRPISATVTDLKFFRPADGADGFAAMSRPASTTLSGTWRSRSAANPCRSSPSDP